MSENIQLEQLLSEKNSAENEGKELDEEQKQLKLRAKVLTEKIIQELRKRNNTKQNAINTLQSKVEELENQLNSLSAPQTSGATDENIMLNDEVETNAVLESLHATDDTVSVTEVSQEIESNAGKDKRKRKIF